MYGYDEGQTTIGKPHGKRGSTVDCLEQKLEIRVFIPGDPNKWIDNPGRKCQR